MVNKRLFDLHWHSKPLHFAPNSGLDVIDLRYNYLEGDIPAGFGSEEYAATSMLMQGNDLLSHPAPLSLCGHVGFDLSQDDSYCPIERNSLKSLYIDAKGNEWTKSDGWLDEYVPHCDWENVFCDDKTTTSDGGGLSRVTHLFLRNDGLRWAWGSFHSYQPSCIFNLWFACIVSVGA